MRFMAAVLAVCLGGLSSEAVAQAFPPVTDLATLDGLDGSGLSEIKPDYESGSPVSSVGDGSAGFVVEGGPESFSNSGNSVSAAGDVNSDGIGDFVIGAYHTDVGGRETAGASYVVFGTDQGFPPVFELSSLAVGDGSMGFVLNGIDWNDLSGRSVSAADDVNADGIADLLIGADNADPGGRNNAGETYVVFGTDTGFPPVFELYSLAVGDGSAGFVLNGIDQGDSSGYAVSAAGDVNGDGIADVVISGHGADPGGRTGAGETYVVFGTDQGFPPVFELSSLAVGDGSTGFVLNGIDQGDYSGFAVSGAGDVNGDGIADVVIYGGRGPNYDYAGETYVVFGTDQGFPPVFELSSLAVGDGSMGFVLNGIDPNDGAGGAVSGAGDINADGIADLLIGAEGADPGGRNWAGETYVVFGTESGFPPVLELYSLAMGDGSTGFVLNGVDEEDASGTAVNSAGDVNGDGIDDLMIGAPAVSGPAEGAGEAYVVFGTDQGFPPVFELSSLAVGDGSTGFALKGIDEDDYTGEAVSAAGDVNGDGIADLLIGAPDADPDGERSAGRSYVVFGTTDGFPAEFELASLLPPTLSITVSGMNGRAAECFNDTNPQSVPVPLDNPMLVETWDCEDLGLSVASGDTVGFLIHGGNFGSALAGTVYRLQDGARAICGNATQDAVVNTPLDSSGQWDCEAAGLPLANFDRVRVFVYGVAK